MLDLPWYDTALLTIGALITGHIYGLIVSKSPLDAAYYAGLDDGVEKGRELERSLHKQQLHRGMWE